MSIRKEKKKRHFPFLIVLLGTLLAVELAGLVFVLQPVFPKKQPDAGVQLPFSLRLREDPDEIIMEISQNGYQMGQESGSYSFDPITGTYMLDNGAALRMLSDRCELKDIHGVTVLYTEEMLRTPRWTLYGTTQAKVPGGYLMAIDFSLDLYEDGSCRLTNSLSDTAFDGSWSKNEDGSLNVSMRRMKMTESVPGKVTLSGNIGLKVSVTLEGTVE